MKKLTRLLLINWYGYSFELIDFGMINFLTGKTASGKSTIIDALQLVLLGETSGNFFNKAANEKSVRTLRSYLYGENGDNGDTGFNYLREGPFSSYVVLEIEDTEKEKMQMIGIGADCHEDLNFDTQWFVVHNHGIPETNFIKPKTETPYRITELKKYFSSQPGKWNVEFCQSNKRYRDVTLAVFGNIKDKYRTLLKKSVPFSPITDIEKFITESICDVKNEIHVEEMQSDIRQYKSLQDDIDRTEKRVAALENISRVSAEFDNAVGRKLQQEYIVIRAEQDEKKAELLHLKQSAEKKEAELQEIRSQIQKFTEEISRAGQIIEGKKKEYFSSDAIKKRDELTEKIERLSREIDEIEKRIQLAVRNTKNYGSVWGSALEGLEERRVQVEKEDRDCVQSMQDISRDTLAEFPFVRVCEQMESLKGRIAEKRRETAGELLALEEEIEELSRKEKNLKKGIKPYPASVTRLREILQIELKKRSGKDVRVPVFADLLEIRDPQWANAIEGYLDRQKFNLLVPEQYFREAGVIYSRAKKEEHLFDVGLVDLGRMRKEFRKQPMKGSLAEEIQTKDPDARLYADFLLGNVMKCEDVRNINQHRISITRDVMLYKGYVTRKLNPKRYEVPFIGRRSMEIQLQQLQKQLKESRKRHDILAETKKVLDLAAKQGILEHYEAKQYADAAGEIPSQEQKRKDQKALQKELDSLDLTYLERLKKEISQMEKEQAERQNRRDGLNSSAGMLQEKVRQLREEQIPFCENALKDVQERMNEQFDAQWMETSGEPHYQDVLRKRSSSTQLSLRESYARTLEATKTIIHQLSDKRKALRGEYNREYKMPYDINREDNEEYDQELHTLKGIRLPDYQDKIKDAEQKAYETFRQDFLSKLKSNIETVQEQISELNNSLRHYVFGTDRYHFTYQPRAEYKSYYKMIMDPMLLDMGAGETLTTANFNDKYKNEIKSMFDMLILKNADVSADRRAEYERNIKKLTDYRTYLVFDMIVTNDQGEQQRLSKTLLKKSGGETQIPFYLSLLASFSQVCRINSRTSSNTIRVIILDEAFSKMDGERIQECIRFLRQSKLQAIFSAPTDKIPDIAPLVDTNIAVYKEGHDSFTRHFDPKEIENEEF